MFYIKIPFLHLENILNSNQMIRWIKVADNKYIIQDGSDVVKVTENTSNRFLFDCSEDKFFSKWFYYFDIKNDYLKINNIARSVSEIKIAANRNKGMRIVRPSMFEVIIYSCIKSLFSVDKTRDAVNYIAMTCGIRHSKSFRESGKINWWEFPTPEMVLEKKELLDNRRLYHQKSNILAICEDIIDGWFDLEYLKLLSYNEAYDYLIQFDYLNDWAVKYICFVSLGFNDIFLYDNHIAKFLKKINLNNLDEFKEWYIDADAEEYSGMLSMYIWNNEVFPPKRLEEWMEE